MSFLVSFILGVAALVALLFSNTTVCNILLTGSVIAGTWFVVKALSVWHAKIEMESDKEAILRATTAIQENHRKRVVLRARGGVEIAEYEGENIAVCQDEDTGVVLVDVDGKMYMHLVLTDDPDSTFHPQE